MRPCKRRGTWVNADAVRLELSSSLRKSVAILGRLGCDWSRTRDDEPSHEAHHLILPSPLTTRQRRRPCGTSWDKKVACRGGDDKPSHEAYYLIFPSLVPTRRRPSATLRDGVRRSSAPLADMSRVAAPRPGPRFRRGGVTARRLGRSNLRPSRFNDRLDDHEKWLDFDIFQQ